MDKDDDLDSVESSFICILISTTILLNLYDGNMMECPNASVVKAVTSE